MGVYLFLSFWGLCRVARKPPFCPHNFLGLQRILIPGNLKNSSKEFQGNHQIPLSNFIFSGIFKEFRDYSRVDNVDDVDVHDDDDDDDDVADIDNVDVDDVDDIDVHDGHDHDDDDDDGDGDGDGDDDDDEDDDDHDDDDDDHDDDDYDDEDDDDHDDDDDDDDVTFNAQVAKLCVARWNPWSWTCAFCPTKHSVFWCSDTSWTSAGRRRGLPSCYCTLCYIVLYIHYIKLKLYMITTYYYTIALWVFNEQSIL